MFSTHPVLGLKMTDVCPSTKRKKEILLTRLPNHFTLSQMAKTVKKAVVDLLFFLYKKTAAAVVQVNII